MTVCFTQTECLKTAIKVFLGLFIIIGSVIHPEQIHAQAKQQRKILLLTERGGQHEGFVIAALRWLDSLALVQDLKLTTINRPDGITTAFLADYDVFVQLDFPPYTWPKEAEDAFERYIESGTGGWIGFHHATLLGDFDGYPLWQWFADFMGGIRFKNYIASLATGTVWVEDQTHPVMRGVPIRFDIPDEEWYTFDRSPRPNVKVLAAVDEASYDPPSDNTMGDHPVVWTNEHMKARNVYFLMGHHGGLFRSAAFMRMFENALLWTSSHDDNEN
ncbi:ThuA domain-containing protein [Parapedobacter sp. 2B3]|uniref:ThuA domain-containing protein n=1 Tax=Parapedobacter sp. 2B3 TaxID=3342381 RepID=UPI0035B57613